MFAEVRAKDGELRWKFAEGQWKYAEARCKDAERAQVKEVNNTRSLAGRVIGKISALSHRLKIAVGDVRNKDIPKAVAKATKDANADIEKKMTEAQSRLSDPRAPLSFDLAACTAAAASFCRTTARERAARALSKRAPSGC